MIMFHRCTEMSNRKRGGIDHPSILIGSINPYSYMGHSQRMFSIANYYAKCNLKVSWINSPSFLFPKNTQFVNSQNVSRHFRLPFLVTRDEVAKDIILSVYDSWALPKYDMIAASLFFTRILQRIYMTVFSGFGKFDVFLFDSPIFADLAEKLKKVHGTLIIYDSPDDYSAYSEIGQSFKKLETKAVNAANFIITPTQSVKTELLRRNKGKIDVRLIPNGVPGCEVAKSPKCRKQSAIPRIGFLGTLASWVDVNLIFNIANRMPNCEFVIVGDGPYYNSWKQNSPSNCKFIGRVSIAKRGDLISSFDVGLIPFKLIPLAHSAFPLKLLEYFARGVPVVSSPLTEVKNIASDYARFANSVETWVEQINKALTDAYGDKLSYIEFASKYTWENTASLILNMISGK